jgi:hypothetical protein
MRLSCPYCGTTSFAPDSIALGAARELRCQQCRTEIALAYQTEPGTPTRVELFDGRYEKLGPPIVSGQGLVYPAYDRSLQTIVAIRELVNPALLPRFEREIELAKVLTHENILAIYDQGQSRDVRYLTTEYLEGDSLERLLQSEEVSYQRALDLMVMACQGMEYAHVRGVVHRALKPANMFVTTEGVLKLMDFGSAVSESDPTRAAPELASEPSAITPRADVWSLGALAYQLFTGALPYPDLEAVQEALPAAPSTLNPRVPAELDALLLRALAVHPEDRPADAGELCETLMALRRRHVPQPVATAPITSVRPAAPTQRSPRTLLFAGVAAAALLGTGALLLRGGETAASSLPRPEPVRAAAVRAPEARQAPAASHTQPSDAPALAASSSPSTRLSAPRCPGGVEPVSGGELKLAQPRPRAWTFATQALPALPLDAFCIDSRPVSVAAYARCVEAGRCAPHEAACTPSSEPSAPMHCVSWEAAQRYCAARGGELPSVAQWEAYGQTPGARTSSSEWAKDAFPPAVFGARCGEENPARCDGHLWRKAGLVPLVSPDGRGRLAFSWNRGAATSVSGYDYVSFRCVVPGRQNYE